MQFTNTLQANSFRKRMYLSLISPYARITRYPALIGYTCSQLRSCGKSCGFPIIFRTVQVKGESTRIIVYVKKCWERARVP